MTPSDADVRINTTPDLFDEADEVHISCLFSWDRQRAEQLADAWAKAGFNVKLGGVAFSSPSEEFVVGRYVKKRCSYNVARLSESLLVLQCLAKRRIVARTTNSRRLYFIRQQHFSLFKRAYFSGF